MNAGTYARLPSRRAPVAWPVRVRFRTVASVARTVGHAAELYESARHPGRDGGRFKSDKPWRNRTYIRASITPQPTRVPAFPPGSDSRSSRPAWTISAWPATS